MEKRAIAYIRVSTEGQAEEDKYGVEAQKEAIKEYAKEHGYRVDKYMVEKKSGASDERPVLDEILFGEISNPPTEAVIVYKNDRIARDTKLFYVYMYYLWKKNIQLVTVKEDSLNQMDKEYRDLITSVLMFVAEQERRNIVMRTTNGKRMKAKTGGYCGGMAPYGYKVEKKQLIVNEDERPMIEYIFKRESEGAPRLRVAKELNEMGYRTRKGTEFKDVNIIKIVANRKLYEGYYKYGPTGEWVKGQHEAILKEEHNEKI